MTLKRIGGALALGALIASSLVTLGTSPAHADTAQPTISSLAWWWEDARTEERQVPGVGTVTIETPNPFCPSAGGGTGSPKCSQGRLPIEVHNGDYETQNKISAVGFDLSLIPIGSKVSKFTATFREAKEGCYENDGKPDDNPRDDTCEETSPINVGKHKLQACLVNAYFGDGEARQYKEVPKYQCTNADPKATRKEVKSNKDGDGSDFYWTFDLTKYAQDWVSEFTSVTGIMLVGVPIIEGKGENAEQDSDTWRVVLTGPNFENGVRTRLVYKPGAAETFPPLDDPGFTDTGGGFTDTGTSFGDTGSTGTTDFGGTTDTGPTEPVEDAGAATPAPTASPVLSVGEAPEVEELPGYIWLAVLAGLVGFSLVRSIVIDKTTGVRPNGVLSTIHRLNAERGGGAAATGSPGPLSAVGGALGAVGAKIGHGLGKLNFRKKG